MREVAFIKQNKEKWLEFERVISNKEKKNRLNESFVSTKTKGQIKSGERENQLFFYIWTENCDVLS